MNISSGSYLMGSGEIPAGMDIPNWAHYGLYDNRIPNWTGQWFVDKKDAEDCWIALGKPSWLSVDEVDDDEDY